MSSPCLIQPLLVFTLAATSPFSPFSTAPPDGFATQWSEIDQAVQAAIDKRRVSGAVVLVGQSNRIVLEKAFGHRSLAPKVEPMTVETRFDLASLTKVVATTPAVMLLAEAGKLKLDDAVIKYLPGFGRRGKTSITIRQLLTHYSGLPPFFRPPRRGPGPDQRLLEKIFLSGTTTSPGQEFIYSDLGFILLGKLVERVSGEPLDQFVQSQVFLPLKMSNTTFRPGRSHHQEVAPTERRADGSFLRGQVHDPLASVMGGVAGHAGVFSTARDLARFCQMMLNEGSIDGTILLHSQTVRQMVSPQSPPGKSNIRGLGWDIQSVYSSVKGEVFSPRSYGHTGFTGTSLWIDPEIQTYLIVLTSRLHPDGKGDVRQLRKEIANIVGTAFSPGQLKSAGDQKGLPASRSDKPPC